MALLEAAASALPVVATDVGGTRDVVIDGQTGFVVPPLAPPALTEALSRMMALGPSERRDMGLAGRAAVVRAFDAQVVIDRWEKTYLSLLDPKARVPGIRPAAGRGAGALQAD